MRTWPIEAALLSGEARNRAVRGAGSLPFRSDLDQAADRRRVGLRCAGGQLQVVRPTVDPVDDEVDAVAELIGRQPAPADFKALTEQRMCGVDNPDSG